MLIPLQQWICDTCSEIIESPEQGWVEWQQDENNKVFNFNIVHHVGHSPRRFSGSNCYQFRASGLYLDRYVGENGLAWLLCFLDHGVHVGRGSYCDDNRQVKDIGEWMELFRRLQVPHYEEARQYFDRATEGGYFHGVWGSIFNPQKLRNIIETYGTNCNENASTSAVTQKGYIYRLISTVLRWKGESHMS